MAEPPADRNRITFDSCQLGGCGEARCGRVQAIPREHRGRSSSCQLRVPSASGGTLPRRRRRSVWFPRSSGAMLDVDRLERQQDRSLHPSQKDQLACPRGCLDHAHQDRRQLTPVHLEASGRTANPSTGRSRQRRSLNQRVDSLSRASRRRPQRPPPQQGPEPVLADSHSSSGPRKARKAYILASTNRSKALTGVPSRHEVVLTPPPLLNIPVLLHESHLRLYQHKIASIRPPPRNRS